MNRPSAVDPAITQRGIARCRARLEGTMSQSRHERDAYREAVLEQRAREASAPRLDPEDWRRWATPAELARDSERRAAEEAPRETLF